MDEFYKTRMGRQFFHVTMPRIATELERLNDHLTRLIALLERNRLEQGGESGSIPPDARTPVVP